MYSVSPKDMERFCLRLLLQHIKGAESYDDLKTVDGNRYDTFKDAAKALNLLEDDQEWDKALQEASIFRMPNELRMLFSVILLHGVPRDSLDLYNKYRPFMYEDYLRNHSEYMAEQLALRDIESHLFQFGKTCKCFDLPTPIDAYDSTTDVHIESEKTLSLNLISQFNPEQRNAFDIIMNAASGNSQHKCYFLSGAGGCGKTFVYKALTSTILGQGGLVKAVAPTGLAATLLKFGKTVHSGFGIPIDLNENTVSRFTQRSKEYKELLNTKLIIWDEVSMCHLHLLQAVDRSLRDLLNCDQPFGGITIVVGGDFQQQAPVVKHGNRVKIVEACVKSSYLWPCFVKLELTQNMRVNANEKSFAEWLLQVGSGKSRIGDAEDFLLIPNDLLTADIVESVFGENINNMSSEDLAGRAILCPKNEDTLKINEHILTLIESPVRSYYSIDSISECESEEERAHYPLEFLHSITPMGLPPHCLNLKTGCCVMLLRNLNPKRGLCNGTRLIVESLGNNLLECSIFSGDLRGQRVFIPRISLDVNDSDLPFKLKRKQFPIRLAYSITITKSQGQTFDKIGVLLNEPVFTHGQLYTAFSRVKSREGLFIKIRTSSRQGKIYENDDCTYTPNCVYREIL